MGGCVCVCMYVYNMYVCVCVCIYECMYACMCVFYDYFIASENSKLSTTRAIK